MKILAWTLLVFLALNVILGPLNFGQPREPETYKTWLGSWLGVVLMLPLIGRILGWW